MNIYYEEYEFETIHEKADYEALRDRVLKIFKRSRAAKLTLRDIIAKLGKRLPIDRRNLHYYLGSVLHGLEHEHITRHDDVLVTRWQLGRAVSDVATQPRYGRTTSHLYANTKPKFNNGIARNSKSIRPDWQEMEV